eukprot:COSAG02_NODE_2266_length_9286_cov_2.788723_11_plen_545_part_00
MATNMFETAPAGTPIEPTHSVRSYYRRQIYPATPSTGENHVAGREIQWRFQASGQHAFVPQESRLVAQVRVDKSNDGGATFDQGVEKSIRYACDPLSRLYDQARLSINGVTVDNVSSDVGDISTIQLRLEGTKAGAAAAGSAGLLSFDQRMHHDELAGTGQGNEAYAYMGGVRQAGAAPGFNGTTLASHEDEVINEKHRILLDAARAGGFGAGAAQDTAREHQLSTPLGQMFTFFRQNKAFLRNMEFDLRLVVSSDGAHDALFTETIPAKPRNQGVLFTAEQAGGATLGYDSNAMAAHALGFEALADADRTFVQLLPSVARAAAETNGAGNVVYRVLVTDLFIDAMFAVPRVSIPPPLSMQVPYQGCSLYTRALAQNREFQEVYSGIPPSITGLVVAMRSQTHSFTDNRELYKAGGSTSDHSFKSFQVQMGSLTVPTPAYDLNFPERKAQRAYEDFISFVGGDHRDGAGAMSYSEWCEAPLLCFRILQNPSEYSSTISLKFSTQNPVPANTTLMVFAIHSKVFEAEWNQGENMPSKVVVDEILA